MLKLLHTLFGGDERSSALSSHTVSISNEELVALLGQIGEKLILFDLRPSAEVERFPYIIPGALLTTHAKLLDLAHWIPPEAIVVLYGAEKISAYFDLLTLLHRDTHFYLLERGIKAWRQARLPMEAVNQLFLEKAPVVWKRDFAGGLGYPTVAKQGIAREGEGS